MSARRDDAAERPRISYNRYVPPERTRRHYSQEARVGRSVGGRSFGRRRTNHGYDGGSSTRREKWPRIDRLFQVGVHGRFACGRQRGDGLGVDRWQVARGEHGCDAGRIDSRPLAAAGWGRFRGDFTFRSGRGQLGQRLTRRGGLEQFGQANFFVVTRFPPQWGDKPASGTACGRRFSRMCGRRDRGLRALQRAIRGRLGRGRGLEQPCRAVGRYHAPKFARFAAARACRGSRRLRGQLLKCLLDIHVGCLFCHASTGGIPLPRGEWAAQGRSRPNPKQRSPAGDPEQFPPSKPLFATL